MKAEPVDILLDSEYFAHYCGFEYPQSEYMSDKGVGILHLTADVKISTENSKVNYGLMVWHNRNYIPIIRIESHDKETHIIIENERQLPYLAKLRTKSWLNGLKNYLETKNEDSDSLQNSKRIFLEGIHTTIQ